MSDDIKLTFLQESEELLQLMEDALLAMEEAPDDEEHLNSVFRSMHTIKGAAGIFGYDFIVSFTHPVETVMDHVRSGVREVDSDLVAVLLLCKDHTASLVQVVADDNEENIPEELLEQGHEILKKLTGEDDSSDPGTELATSHRNIETLPIRASSADNWVIALDFKVDALRNGLDPLSFLRYLQRLGEIIDIVTLTEHLPSAADMDPESCYLSFRIAFNSSASKNDIEDVFEFALDDCDIRILPPNSKQESYLDLLENREPADLERLGDILVEIGAITAHELSVALNEQDASIDEAVGKSDQDVKLLGEILVDRSLVASAVVEKAVEKQEDTREKASKNSQYIRVDADRLGQLINLVGELVISNAAVKLMVGKYEIQEVDEVVAGVDNLVENIRDHALQLRMVQIGDTFSRFRRVVRDVSKELDKDIKLIITGGEAELDKTVVEKINDPLTHLVRNSLDHGIETPEERLAKGKPAQGVLRLNALHDSGHIVIQIADDGAGLDTDKIRAKAEAIGLVRPDQVLSHRETLRLIFEPGLSTSSKRLIYLDAVLGWTL